MSSEKAKVDKKTELTFQTVEKLKISTQLLAEFVKAAQNYQKQAQRLAEAGRAMADALTKVGQLQVGDVGDGIKRLAEIQKSIENRREQVGAAIANDLIASIERVAKVEQSEVTNFENDYKKVRASVRSQITKLEADTKKAGKKSPEMLKQSIAALNDKVREAEQLKSEKLRQILLLERKKYCSLLGMWAPVINAQIDLHSEGGRLKENLQYWNNLAISSQQLPGDAENLIKTQERTFVSLPGSSQDEYNYSSQFNTSYDSPSFGRYDSSSNLNASYNSGFSSPQPPSYIQSYGLGTCTALYDFAGEQAEDLSFYAGEVITITKEDDGTGWIHGELNGVRGIFPSTYVQRN